MSKKPVLYKCNKASVCTEADGCDHAKPHQRDKDLDTCDGLCEHFRDCEEHNDSEDALCLLVPVPHRSFSLLWSMYWQGFQEAQKQKLTEWHNWTPLLYYVAATYLVAGVLVSLSCTFFWWLVLMILGAWG